MPIRWQWISRGIRTTLKPAWLITAALCSLYLGMKPLVDHNELAMQKATGLGAPGWEPVSLWKQSSVLTYLGGYGENSAPAGTSSLPLRASLVDESARNSETPPQDRKLVRAAGLDLVVASPADTAARIGALVQSAGGFLVNSQVNGGPEASSASLNARIPGPQFEDVRTKIRKLAFRVESETINAQDVTRQYVDQEARLRNLRAQEQQYLGILRKAVTVKDILEVSDKMDEVRGAIEARQAELQALSKQVETVAIEVTMRSESDAQVFGLRWRPLYQLKVSAREGLEGLGAYVAAMTAFVFYLPSILLWLFTILAGAAVVWRILRWAARLFFRAGKHELPATSAGKPE